MDYMKNGSLAYIIFKESKGLLTIDYDNTKRQSILIGIARGMMILHKLNIIHRDLKPENIVMDDQYHPHITDFGLSKFFDPQNSKKQSLTCAGTMAYMAPEVIESDKFNTKADVYAYGIIMYEVLNGKRAYEDVLYGKNKLSDFQFKRRVIEGLRPEIIEGSMKKRFQLMIEKCWSNNPSEKPTFSELYKKLSLIEEDSIFDLTENDEKEVINCNDEEEEEGFRTTYCLPSVNFDELFDYIDEISVDAKSLNNPSVDSEELEKLKFEIDQLKSKTERQELTISSLNTELEKVKNKNKKLKNDYKQCKIQLGKINAQFIEMFILPQEYRPFIDEYDYDYDYLLSHEIGIIRNLIETITISYIWRKCKT